MIVIEHPSGTLATEFELEGTNENPVVRRAAFVRTARKIMAGEVYVPGAVWSGREAMRRAKAAWTVFMIVLPFIGALIYLGKHHDGMAERSLKQARVEQAAFDDHIKSVATNGGGGAAAEIDKAKGLLDSGTINQLEFDALKAKALA